MLDSQEIEPLLEEAKTHLEFGDRDKAVYHGARAWQIDPYNDKVRTFLRHISSPFKAMFELEERAVSKLQKRWLLRAWRLSYVGTTFALWIRLGRSQRAFDQLISKSNCG